VLAPLWCAQVISHLYEDHGEEVAGMLDGMFSFVVLDTRNNSFMIARVRAGQAPAGVLVGWGRVDDDASWACTAMQARHLAA
jgi:asparagine synthase (glutamine-hydrolysing)